jgi:hypothetical protein
VRLNWRNSVVVWEGSDGDVRAIAQFILKGMRWFRRMLRVSVVSSWAINLDLPLRRMAAPRKILLVAHGRDGRFWFTRDGEALSQSLPEVWWDAHDKGTGVYAFGCTSSDCFDEYQLRGRVDAYLGYSEEVSFFVGTRRARKLTANVLAGIGSLFVRANRIDASFLADVEGEYIKWMTKVAANYNVAAGDRLSLIFLEEQIQGLQLLR